MIAAEQTETAHELGGAAAAAEPTRSCGSGSGSGRALPQAARGRHAQTSGRTPVPDAAGRARVAPDDHCPFFLFL